MNKAQRSIWTLSMSVRAQMNAIMQDLTGSVYHTSDQHVDTLGSRILRDSENLQKLLKFLEPVQPFNGGQEIMNIVRKLESPFQGNLKRVLVNIP